MVEEDLPGFLQGLHVKIDVAFGVHRCSSI
jgi:hypothetical protein